MSDAAALVGSVNLQEMADLLGVASNTLAARIRNNPDFPVLERGSNGVAYRFDPVAVAEYERASKEKTDADFAERRRLLAATEMELFPKSGTEEADPAAAALSPAERIQLIDAQLRLDKLRRSRGELVERAAIESALILAVTELRTVLTRLPADFARAEGLEREQRIRLEKSIEAALNLCADRLSQATFYDNAQSEAA